LVDNDSEDKNKLRDLCRTAGSRDFIEVGFNSGVAHALRRGISYANRYAPDWLLFLDDDTILMDNAVDRAIGLIQISNLSSRIGAVLLGSQDGNCDIGEVKYGVFSGALIRADVAAKVCCRDEFFMDQADFDMYSRIRELGYITLGIKCKLIDHKLGTRRWVPMLCRYVPYEPPWRYYYVVRNSTKLLS
jgi:rhamnosyltransferase